MKRIILIAVLLVASQPLLVGAGFLVKWAIECSGGTCAGTVYATSPFGPPRDMVLTMVAVAAPSLLVVLIGTVTWVLTTLTNRMAAPSAAEPIPPSLASEAVDQALAGGTRAGQGRRMLAPAVPYAASDSVPIAMRREVAA